MLAGTEAPLPATAVEATEAREAMEEEEAFSSAGAMEVPSCPAVAALLLAASLLLASCCCNSSLAWLVAF